MCLSTHGQAAQRTQSDLIDARLARSRPLLLVMQRPGCITKTCLKVSESMEEPIPRLPKRGWDHKVRDQHPSSQVRGGSVVDVRAGGGAGSSGNGYVLSDAVDSAMYSRLSVGQKNHGEKKMSKLWGTKGHRW